MSKGDSVEEIISFRNQLYTYFQARAGATMDLLDALCSNITADSVVKLSLNTLHRRQYSSITDVTEHFHDGGQEQQQAIQALLVRTALANNQQCQRILLGMDATPAPRKYSATLNDRSVIYCPNPVLDNKPISIGHKYSTVAFLPPKSPDAPPWILPLSTVRISTTVNEYEQAAKQVLAVINDIKQQSQTEALIVQTLDSGYSKANFIHAVHQPTQKQLVTIVRARHNRVFWRKADERRNYINRRGHERWYGKAFRLSDSSTWGEPGKTAVLATTTKNGKLITVHLAGWENILIRTTAGIPMHQHPMTLCRATITDEHGNRVFKRPLWLMVFGEQRELLTLEDIFNDYRQRFDIEHFFKWGKMRMLLNKYQTPDTQHEENWWQLVHLAYAQLFVSRKATTPAFIYPWEKYLPNYQKTNVVNTPTQVQRAFEYLTQTIGTPAPPPKPRGNPLGRARGSKQIKRTRHRVVFKRQRSQVKLE